MNIATNPWSFVSTDIASSTAAASPTGMIQQGAAPNERALGSVLYTSTAPHNLLANQFVTYITDTNSRFLGFYRVIAVPTTTTALLQNLSSPTSGQSFSNVIAASGGGTMLVNQVQQMVRIEDISVQATVAAPTAGQLILLDRNGNFSWDLWQLAAGTGVGATPPAQNRGKLMWVDGMTWQLLPVGLIALVTVN
jgi:hypothetical protein